MTYSPRFDPVALDTIRPRSAQGPVGYLYDEPLTLAVNVALAAGRPLLLRGNPGTGKSTLAEDVAWKLSWRYLAEPVTSRTQARDLQWRFDAVLRLADANPGSGGDPGNLKRYVRPGVLWWAFSPETGRAQGPNPAPGAGGESPNAVVLIDEIDKADPDVPNDMLNLIDRRAFSVEETGEKVAASASRATFIVFTTNGERDLPAAFLRRCIAYEIPDPGKERLDQIVRHHERTADDGLGLIEQPLLDDILALLVTLKRRAGDRRPPATAELLDAVMACRTLSVTSNSDPKWKEICEAALWKHGREERPVR